MGDLVLEARGVGYRHGRRAPGGGIRDLDLEVRAGRALGLVGASGSGKSTALALLLGRLTPQEGEVRWRGAPLPRGGTRRLRPLRRDVQLVPQDPAASLDPRHDVTRIVTEPLRRLQVPGDHDRLVRDALDAVGLDATLHHRRPAELSGGQAQRAAIARALATGARVLLADEPVSGLDPALREQVLDVVSALVTDRGVGLLLVSHDLDVVARTCGDLVVLAASEGADSSCGSVVDRGPTDVLLRRPTQPATAALVAARLP